MYDAILTCMIAISPCMLPYKGVQCNSSLHAMCDGVTNACYNKLMSLHLVPIYKKGAREVWALLNGIFAWEDLV